MNLDIALLFQGPQMKMGRVEGLKPKVIAQFSYGGREPVLCIEIHKEI
jgi:hypothetical protein